MRTEKAVKNVISNLLLQVILVGAGILLPKFFIQTYGSTVNGMISSVGQFLVYLSLVESGISAATIVELYQPIHLHQRNDINTILSATRAFYQKAGCIYIVLLVMLTVGYPYLVLGQVDATTTRLMILIIGSGSAFDYFILGKYTVILNADQNLYVINYFRSMATILTTIITLIMILLHVDVVLVQLAGAIINAFRVATLVAYTKRKYNYLEFHQPYGSHVLKQRWAALVHQIAGVIINNTDMVIMTICLGRNSLLEVSVYYLYHMVIEGINSLIYSFSNGLSSGFGELFAIQDNETLHKSYQDYEYLLFLILFFLYTCVSVLLLPFISVYTKEITDVQYVRPQIALLFIVVGILQTIRIPGLTMICAAGHYEETKYRAIVEAIINVTISLCLVERYGMAGVLFGTICSYAYRTMDIVIYNNRYLITRTISLTIQRVIRNLGCMMVVLVVGLRIFSFVQNTWWGWIESAVLLSLIVALVLFGFNYLLEPLTMKRIVRRICRIIRKRE